MADDDDSWFDSEARERGRERIAARDDDDDGDAPKGFPMPLVLGGLIVVVLILGVALGAFSSPPEPQPAPIASLDLEALRTTARQNNGNGALDEATLFAALDQLHGAAAKPTPVEPPVPPEPIETGTTVIEDPKPKPLPPKDPKDTKPVEAKDPKAPKDPKDTKVADKVDPKPPDTVEAKPPSNVEPTDPKNLTSADKNALETALANAKTAADGGKWGEARSAYDKALSLAPGNATALYGRGRASFELKQSGAAAKDLEAVLAGNPKHPGALQLMGSLMQEQGKKAEAKQYYQRYLDAWPNGRQANQIRAILERL